MAFDILSLKLYRTLQFLIRTYPYCSDALFLIFIFKTICFCADAYVYRYFCLFFYLSYLFYVSFPNFVMNSSNFRTAIWIDVFSYVCGSVS
jgi:hypothetical protein